MSQKSQSRIELNPAQEGLNAAFAGLSLAGLPAGPEPSSTVAPPATPRGKILLRRETAHRGGKAVVIVHGFATHYQALEVESLGKKLRAACGCGGTVREREIELQGDQVKKVRELLEEWGYQVGGVLS